MRFSETAILSFSCVWFCEIRGMGLSWYWEHLCTLWGWLPNQRFCASFFIFCSNKHSQL